MGLNYNLSFHEALKISSPLCETQVTMYRNEIHILPKDSGEDQDVSNPDCDVFKNAYLDPS